MPRNNLRLAGFKRHVGATLVEIVVFIAIVSVALAGVLSVLHYTSGSSANPLARKQALIIAESVMQEIQQVPFTYCDPDDANAVSATSAAGCAVAANNQNLSITGPTPSGESRYDATNPFDNVADYGGFAMPGGACSGICRLGDNTPIAGLGAYAVSVVLSRVGGTAPFTSMASDDVLKIDVTVTGPANTRVVLTGYRVRYAPNI